MRSGAILDTYTPSDGTSSHLGTHGIEESRAYFSPGTYQVKVQDMVENKGHMAFNLWTLVVETLTT